MAKIIPDDIYKMELADTHSGELETLLQLKKQLPNDYTVFHSVHWTQAFSSYTVFGEIDFVIVDQTGKVIVIEQKNGALKETEHGLFKTYYGGGKKDVSAQIHRNIDNLRDKFKKDFGQRKGLIVDYIIYCPDYKITQVKSIGLDYSRIVDANHKPGLAATIQKLSDTGNQEDKIWADTVTRFFYQSFQVVPDIHSYKQHQQKTFTRLSGGLVKLVDNLEMTPFRLKVLGVAGSGKSQAAVHYYDQCLNRDKKPLLICFNRSLSERLKNAVQPGGMVNTWYGLCNDFLKSKGQTLDFKRMKTDPIFWKEIEETVMASDISEEWQFDAIIIDEGQDIEPESKEILRLFIKENADILWLEDEVQNLRQTDGNDSWHLIKYHARENFRTPHTIAKFIRETLPFEFECANPLPGLGVRIHDYEKDSDQKKIVDKIVKELVKLGFKHEDIVILSCKGFSKSYFSDLASVAGIPLKRFTGEYQTNGQQIFTEGKIRFDSIYRFKGQQSTAVILVDVEQENKSLEQFQRLLFTGMTRAMVRLEIVKSINLEL